MRAVRPILFVGLRFALSNDRGLAPRRHAPPIEAPVGRPKGRWIPLARIVPVFVPTNPLARRRGVLGRRSRFTTALQPPNPRRGACARKVPTWRLNCRCPSARRGGVGVEVRGASSQRWLCRVPPVGVGVVRCVSPTAASGTSTPAPDWFVPRSSPKLPLLVPSGAGRGLKVCSSCRRCVLRASNGFSANDGGDAVGEAAQNRARRFSFKRAWRKNCRARFTALRRASPPIQ